MCTVLCWQANWGNPILRSTLPLISASLLGTRHKNHNFFYGMNVQHKNQYFSLKSLVYISWNKRERENYVYKQEATRIHAITFNDRRSKDIWKFHCHGFQLGGRGNTFTTGSLVFLWIELCLLWTVYNECWTEWHIIWCHNLGNSLLLMK